MGVRRQSRYLPDLDFGKWLKEKRAARGMSQGDLAYAAGLSPAGGDSLISNIERGSTKAPAWTTWVLLCRALGCDERTGEDLPHPIATAPVEWELRDESGKVIEDAGPFDFHARFKPGTKLEVRYRGRSGWLELTQDGARYLWLPRAHRKTDKKRGGKK